MAAETVHVVQAFVAGKRNALRAEVPIRCRSADAARRTSERLAPGKAGVGAFSAITDAELGDYDEAPTILYRAGRLPESFDEA